VVAFAKSRLLDMGRSRVPVSVFSSVTTHGAVESANEAVRHALFVSIGDLTPQTAAADLLECVVCLAEDAPWQPLRIRWIGEGALRGVLKAQPLPETLSQHFLGTLRDSEVVSELANADVLCFTGHARNSAQITGAIRGLGLPVIGCADNESVSQLVREGHPGWSFDERQPASIMKALARALDAHAALALVSTIGIGVTAEQS
jgi:hypothetical protein